MFKVFTYKFLTNLSTCPNLLRDFVQCAAHIFSENFSIIWAGYSDVGYAAKSTIESLKGRINMKKYFVLLVLFIVSSAGYSAEVKVGNDEFNNAVIFITGKIEKGDYNKVENSARNFIKFIAQDSDQGLKFILNSEGGDVEEAIKIGLLFRKTLSAVHVWGSRLIHESESEAQWVMSHRLKGLAEKYATQNKVIYSEKRPITEQDIKKCYSACVLMFLGGTQKQISDNHYWIDGFRADEKKDIPVIGLHRPYYSKEQYAELNANEAAASYKKLEAIVRNYLGDIGATQELVDRIFKSASNEIDLVKDSEFKRMFHQEEPFYNEWIIAKCGAFDNGEGLLSKEDIDYKNSVWSAKTKEVRRLMKIHGGGPENYNHIYENFIPEEFKKEEYLKIISVVQSHNLKQRTCKETAVKKHQLEYFSQQQ